MQDYDYYSDLDLLCPTCWGNGFINIDTENFSSIKIACPQCQGGLQRRFEQKEKDNDKEKNKMKEYENKDCLDSEETWADRFRAEYGYVKRKYNNLHKMIVQYEAGTLDFTPNCSLELLKRQAKAMGEYLYALELRAEIEGIELE